MGERFREREGEVETRDRERGERLGEREGGVETETERV